MLMAALLISTLTIAQHTVNLKVVDAEDERPLPGSNVVLDGRGQVADVDGYVNFTKIDQGNHSLSISFVGYKTLKITLAVTGELRQTLKLVPQPYLTDEVILSATRADDNTPVTFKTVEKEKIEALNFGQDLPFILNYTPSLVTTSDAGAGIGYTGLRIRGSDATRVNVTINGIPLNDSESQGVFWVDIPDIASSTESIQIQRGVGTSTNGAGAFGGTVNLQTNARKEKAYADIINGYGSFNTRRHTLGFGTGLLNDKWTVDGRLSRIESDGYIDRATSDLRSYYFAAGFYEGNTMVKAMAFGGKERTYQSWYGTPEAVLDNDVEGIEAVIANNGLNAEQAANMRTAGRTFNWYLYENQVDDYAQDHYQLHVSQRLSDAWTANLSGHYTYGRGFYEQYRYDDDYEDYGLPNVTVGAETIESTDLIRRRWLDNDFYGATFSAIYDNAQLATLTIGGAWNSYQGDHFGELIWAEYANFEVGDRYYFSDASKEDFNIYAKTDLQLTNDLSGYIDLQYRNIDYTSEGTDNDLQAISIDRNFDFFNPKLGAYYQLANNAGIYASFAIANREPVRSDIIDSPVRPRAERLYNWEAGYRQTSNKSQYGFNMYYMDYKDQLILTGELNDVGAAIRTNVPESYRLGIELDGAVRFNDYFMWTANLTLSRNKIGTFTEVLYDYGAAFDEFNIVENTYENTDIAYSPNVIAGSQLTFNPVKEAELTLLSKYVGDQYLDNTSNERRQIDAYFVNDIRMSYSFSTSGIREVKLSVLVNNIFDTLYASNGYTFGYSGGPEYVVRENYLYPQATRNFMATLTLRL